MAATLLHIKIQAVCCLRKNAMLTDEGEDPREELVMRFAGLSTLQKTPGRPAA